MLESPAIVSPQSGHFLMLLVPSAGRKSKIAAQRGKRKQSINHPNGLLPLLFASTIPMNPAIRESINIRVIVL